MNYEIVCGLEVHVEMNTKSKIFCACSTAFGGEPNTHVCPVCSGQPGALPTLNRAAVEKAARTGLALGCDIAPVTRFDRKNYFYPDLPKAYQISQLYAPICRGGGLALESGRFIRLHEIHMEEDAGKLVHDPFTETTLCDYNRCGVPLMEIVTEPDFRSGEEAADFLERLRTLLDFLGVSDCKMQEGSIRADVNVSVRPVGSEALGVRTEMKNLNSIKAVAHAVRAEAERQIELLREGRAVRQETRRWDDNKGASFAMRSKENAQDYRYFPEPDLPPVVLDEAFLSQVRRSMPELPEQKRARYLAEYGLTERDAAILLRSARLCRLLEGLIGRGIPAREAANWTLGEVLRLLGEDGLEPADLEIDEEKLARALRLLAAGRIGRPAARRAVEAVYREGADPELFCREHGLFLEKVGEGDLAAAVAKVLAENADAVEKYRAGSDKVFGFLVGRCMAALRGKADPASVNRALREALKR